jgi:putative hydrolase of the HAD superfamily
MSDSKQTLSAFGRTLARSMKARPAPSYSGLGSRASELLTRYARYMPPTAIFFDMDDTLLDGVAAMTAAWNSVCGEWAPQLGCEAEALRLAIRHQSEIFWQNEAAVETEWRTRLAQAREHVVRLTLECEGWDSAHAETIARRYGEEHRRNLALFGDSLQTLECLRTAGFRLGLLTNGPAAMQRDKIERFGLEPYFDVIVIEGEFGNGKPHERVFRHALEVTGAAPETAWHVGDNLYADVGGAKAVGIHGVWIHRDRLEMKEGAAAIPDRVIGHLPELCEALGVQMPALSASNA